MSKKKLEKLLEEDNYPGYKYHVDLPKSKYKKETEVVPHRHPSTHKKIEIVYRLANEYTEDALEDLINTIQIDGIDIITVHTGYVRDPLGKNKEAPC